MALASGVYAEKDTTLVPPGQGAESAVNYLQSPSPAKRKIKVDGLVANVGLLGIPADTISVNMVGCKIDIKELYIEPPPQKQAFVKK